MTITRTAGAVVVGVDDDERSRPALEWATDRAARAHRRLVAVHGTGFATARPSAADQATAERALLERGRQTVEAAVAAARQRHPGLDAGGIAEVGDPATVLLGHADGAALLVVGAHRQGTREHILSSVSLAAARHAPCPLVVVPGADLAGPVPRDRVVLGLDGTAVSVDAAAFAFASASLARQPLEVLHGSWHSAPLRVSVAAEEGGAEEGGAEDPLTEEESLSLAEVIAGLPEKYPDVAYEIVHGTGGAARALIDASATASLVVVGARRLGSAWGTILTRSVSTALVQHARAPVAVVKPAP